MVGILGSGNSIEPVPESEIEAVRGLLESSTECDQANPLLQEGIWVRVKRGPLKNLEGLFDSGEKSNPASGVDHLALAVSIDRNRCERRAVFAFDGPAVPPNRVIACPGGSLVYPNLKLQLWKTGIRQNRLAKMLRVDETRISRIVNGYREPNAELREKILPTY